MWLGEEKCQSDHTSLEKPFKCTFWGWRCVSILRLYGWTLRVFIEHCFASSSPKPQVGQGRKDSKPGTFASIISASDSITIEMDVSGIEHGLLHGYRCFL